MLKAQKSLGKRGRKGTKDSGTPTQESTIESTSLKFMKNFFISIPGFKSSWQDDCEDLFLEHKAKYGNCYYFGNDDKKSINIFKGCLRGSYQNVSLLS